jgi:hypothetical protein
MKIANNSLFKYSAVTSLRDGLSMPRVMRGEVRVKEVEEVE